MIGAIEKLDHKRKETDSTKKLLFADRYLITNEKKLVKYVLMQ